MPLYTYRREDGTLFDIKQSFSDEPLTVDPETGQAVVRVVQAAPVIFKGSGFYVNDSRGKTNSTLSSPPKSDSGKNTGSDTASSAAATAAAAD